MDKQTIKLTLGLPINADIRLDFEYENFNSKFVGATLENGDVATGDVCYADGEFWYIVTDKNGNEYETREQPCERIDFSNFLELRADGKLWVQENAFFPLVK